MPPRRPGSRRPVAPSSSSRRGRGCRPRPPCRSRSRRWSPSTGTVAAPPRWAHRRWPTPRAAASAAAPRSTAASGTGSPTTSPRTGGARTPSTSSPTSTLERYAEEMEATIGVSSLPGPPPVSSAVLADGATKLGWESTEFPRVFRYAPRRLGRQADDDPHDAAVWRPRPAPSSSRAAGSGASTFAGGRVTGAQAVLTHDDGTTETVQLRADHVFVCGGAIQSPALLQRSGIRRGIGNGLKLHPTIKVAARFPFPVDHDDVPMHRIIEFAPYLTIGGSASRRGQVALALAESGAPVRGGAGGLGVGRRLLRGDPQRGLGAGHRRSRVRGADRDLPAHARRPEPAGSRPHPPRRGAPGGRRHRAVPVGDRRRGRPRRARGWASGGTRSRRRGPTS